MTVNTRTNERPTPPVNGVAAEPGSRSGPDLDLTRLTTRRATQRCEPARSHLVPLGSPSPAAPIFCAHGFDGVASRFRPLSASVDGFRVIGIQVAGIDGLRPMHRTLDEMVTAYVDEMRALHRDRSFVLLGHAEGGVLAWELAQRLTRLGEAVGALLLIDAVNPAIGAVHRQVRTHLDGLSRQPVAHSIEQVAAALRRRRRSKALNSPGAFSSEPVDAGVRSPVPLDVRMHRLDANTRTLLNDYTPSPFAGRVLHFESASPPDTRFRGSAADSWRPVAPHLEVVPLQSTPAVALNDPHAARLGRLLSSWLPTPD